jgi:hypothetical protein
MTLDRDAMPAQAPRRLARLVVQGEFGPLLSTAFPDGDVSVESGRTCIVIRVRDEAELFMLLERLRDFGAALVSVSIEP